VCTHIVMPTCIDIPVQALAQEVACYLGLDLGGIKIKRFADGEIYVQVLVRTRGFLFRNQWSAAPACQTPMHYSGAPARCPMSACRSRSVAAMCS
jgi:N-terminal domain of ribose phosphate pyrophosphokinase